MELGSRSRIAPIAQSIYGRPRVVHFRRKLQLLPSLVCDDDVDPHFLRLGFNALPVPMAHIILWVTTQTQLFLTPPKELFSLSGE